MSWLTRFGVVCLVSGVTLAAPAQEDEDIDLSGFDFGELNLEDEFALLAEEDVVISAAKRTQRIADSSSAITVLTREQIRASGYDNMMDLMRLVPGADVFRTKQSHGTVGFRAGSTTAGDLTLALADGRDVAYHLMGQPLWVILPFDVDEIERIEVIRGPGSTLYGANALQGVVNIVTRRPGPRPFQIEGLIDHSGGTSFLRSSLRAHGTVGDFGYWASLGYSRRSPYLQPQHKGLETLQARLRGDWRGEDDRAATLELGYIDGYGDLFIALGNGRGGTRWPYARAWLKLGRTELQLIVDQSRGLFDLDFSLALPASGNIPTTVLATVPIIDHPTRSARLTGHHSLELFEDSLLTFGADGMAIHHRPASFVFCDMADPRDFTLFDADACLPRSVIEFRGGAFGQFEWGIVEDLTLTTGFRVDLTNLTREPGLSPRAALVWQVAENQTLRTGAGRAFRKPTYFESNGHILIEPAPGAPGDVAQRLNHLLGAGIGNPDLINEKFTQLELGWRGTFLDETLSATIDTYYGLHVDSIEFTGDIEVVPGFGGLPTIPADTWLAFETHSEPFHSLGAEAVVSYEPADWITVGASYAFELSYQDPLDDDGNRVGFLELAREPDHRVAANLRLRSEAGFIFGVDAFWVSGYNDKLIDPESVAGPSTEIFLGNFTLLNGSARYRKELNEEGSTIEVGASIFNVLDINKRELPGAGGGQPGELAFGADRLGRRVRIFVDLRY